ncbi:unnamed protein product [Rhizophagus irregularis]|nr:hypothetical protein RhiirB3_426888 [Rhizophagus irregularis]CAB4479407.1 unnamed protein product [Rhizophagus irregularis]
MEKNIQDAELEALLKYNSAEEFSDTDSLNGISDNEYEIGDIAEEEEKEEEKEEEEDTMKLYVGKTFYNWDHVVDKTTQEITNEHTCVTMLKKLSPNHQKDKLHLAKLNVYGE